MHTHLLFCLSTHPHVGLIKLEELHTTVSPSQARSQLPCKASVPAYSIAAMAKFCSECGGASVKVTARFCTDCGAAFKEPVEADFSVDYDLVADSDPAPGVVRGENAIGRSESAPPPAFSREQSGVSRAASTDGLPRQQSAPMQRAHSQSQPLGLLKSRYSNHPNCDLCNIAFDVTKRRHQWYGMLRL